MFGGLGISGTQLAPAVFLASAAGSVLWSNNFNLPGCVVYLYHHLIMHLLLGHIVTVADPGGGGGGGGGGGLQTPPPRISNN